MKKIYKFHYEISNLDHYAKEKSMKNYGNNRLYEQLIKSIKAFIKVYNPLVIMQKNITTSLPLH